MVKFRVSRLDGVEGGDVEADGGEGGDPTEPVVIKGGVVYEEPTPDDLPPDPGPEDPYPRTPDEEYDEFANRILKATLQLVNDLRTNRQRETSVDVVDLDLAGSTRLVYSLLEQNFQVAVNPSTLPKQHRDIDWPSLITAHPGIDNSATQALEALQKEFNKPIQVVAQARKNVAPLWTQALPWPTQTPSPRQIEGAGQVFDQSQAPAAPWPVAPTPPDAGYDARTQWIEGQNEARLQAYAQQQAARQAVPLQASQPRNAYGWLAQRIGNVFSSAAYAAPVPAKPTAATQPPLSEKERLKQHMDLIKAAFKIAEPELAKPENKHAVFSPADYQQPINDKDVTERVAILKGALFGTRGKAFTPQEVAQLQFKILHDAFSDEELRTLKLAWKLDTIIRQYGKKNDALATAMGIQAVADANTHNGVLDKDRFKEDLAKHFIDQKLKARESDTIPSPVGLGAKALHNIGESPLAAALFGRERVGTYGWKDEFKEKGNSNINQAHHLAMFIIVGMERSTVFAELESTVLDGGILFKDLIGERNPVDLILSTTAIRIGRQIEKDKIQTRDIYTYIKKEISG